MKRIILLLTVVLVLGTILVGCGKNADSVKQQFSKGNSTEALAVYSELKDESQKKASIDYLNSQIDQAYNDFVSEKITYDSAEKILDGAAQFKEIADKANENLKKLADLNNSRKAYADGQKFQETKNYSQALEAYSKVIKDDKNFDTAQAKIKEVNKQLEDSQEVVITGDVKITENIIGEKEGTLRFVNKSNKVVKTVYATFLAYDSNGYPVKLNMGFDKEFSAKADINVQPGQTSDDCTWTLYADKNATKYLALVRKVDYYDGTTWQNPLFDTWHAEHFDKPFK